MASFNTSLDICLYVRCYLLIEAKKVEDIKTDLEKYFKSSASVVKQLPDATEIKILTKNSISNYFNKCYISIIIHSLL